MVETSKRGEESKKNQKYSYDKGQDHGDDSFYFIIR